jgi:hypothetical protein
MLDSSQFFYTLKDDFLDHDAVMQMVDQAHVSQWKTAHAFEMLVIPVNTVSWQTKWVKEFFDNFVCDIHLLCIDPSTFYHWHTDIPRKVAVNVLLNGFDGHAFYSAAKRLHSKPTIELRETCEVPYASNKGILMNLKQPHCVFTREQRRMLLSLSLYDIHYNDVKQFCIEHNL